MTHRQQHTTKLATPPPARFALLAAVATMLACLAAIPAQAESGGIANLPPVKSPKYTGLYVAVDTRWVEGGGYRPVTYIVNSGAAAPADRTLSFEFKGYTVWNSAGVAISVVTELELPAGSTLVRKTIYVPEFTPWQSYSVDVSVDGVPDPIISHPITGLSGVGNNYSNVTLPNVLYVGKLPDLAKLSEAIQTATGSSGGYNRYPPSGSVMDSNVVAVDVQDLPDRWIGYTSLDLIFLSASDVATLREQRPTQWKAIRDWVRTGGNLIVSDAHDDWSRLAEIEAALGISTDKDSSSEGASKSPPRGWKAPDNGQFREIAEAKAAAAAANAATINEGIVESPTPGTIPRPQKPPQEAGFVWREAELGRVVAFASENPFPGDSIIWQWMLTSLGTGQWDWAMRHGVSMTAENAGFWDFSIPDVGLAPVGTYRVLITLFVIAIGPVNFWFLRRYHRIHLLFFTVPATALVISLFLFAYAFLSDGLGVRLRARSYTHLDQQTAEADTWSRVSYYAGLAPVGGIKFPAETAVLPLEYVPRVTYYDRPPRRYLTWDDEQLMTRGWINSRTPTQFITATARDSKRTLQFTEPPDEKSAAKVKNLLGGKVRHVLARTADGKLGYAADVPADGEGPLQPVEESPETPGEFGEDAFKAVLLPAAQLLPTPLPAMAEEFAANVPKLPLDTAPTSNRMFGINRRSFYYPGSSSSSGYTAGERSARMESSLAAAHRKLFVRSLIPKQSYIAIVEENPEVAKGLDSAREESSFHVIEGSW